MPGVNDTAYTARFALPDLIERERANTLQCRVYRDGALVAPASGTVVVYDRAGASLVSGSATITGSIATYSWTPASTVALQEGARIEWTLTVAGVVNLFRNEAAIVRHRLYCPVTDADLFAAQPSLDPAGSKPIHSQSSLQGYIDEAWLRIQRRLIQAGNRPNLIVGPSELREVSLLLSLSLVFEAFSTRLNEAYMGHADRYRGQYDEAWSRLSFAYAPGDGQTHDPNRKRSGSAVLFLGTSKGVL